VEKTTITVVPLTQYEKKAFFRANTRNLGHLFINNAFPTTARHTVAAFMSYAPAVVVPSNLMGVDNKTINSLPT
jgi:hypothetical protein